MRFLSCAVIGALLAVASLNPLCSQDPPPSVQPPADQFFAGIVTALSEGSITITRNVLGKPTVHTFAVTAETVVEGGKPKLKSKVTVKFVSGDNGDRAVKIILRGAVPPPKKQ